MQHTLKQIIEALSERLRLKPLSLKRFFFTYCASFIIPMLMVLVFVKVSYVDRLYASYSNSLEGYALELKERCDNLFLRMQDAVSGVTADPALQVAYSPSQPLAVNTLTSALGEYAIRIDGLAELVYWNADNEYLFSNLSSYTIERFAASRGLNLDADGLRELLHTAQRWQCLSGVYAQRSQLLLFYPLSDPVKGTRVFIFILDQSSLSSILQDGLKNNLGSAALLNEAGEALCVSGQCARPVLTATASSAAAPFSYQLSVHAGSLVDGLSAMKWLWFVVLMLSLLSGTLIAVLFSRSSVEPIQTLRRKFSGDEWRQGNDFEFLCQSIESKQADLQCLQDCAQTVQDYLAEELLLGSEYAASALNILVGAFGLPERIRYWQVALFTARGEGDSLSVLARIQILLPEGAFALLRQARADQRCALLVACSEEASLPAGLLVQGLAQDRACGVSLPIECPEELPLAYLQAAAALDEGKTDFSLPEAISDLLSDLLKLIDEGAPACIAEGIQDSLKALEAHSLDWSSACLVGVRILLRCRRRLSAESKRPAALRLDDLLYARPGSPAEPLHLLREKLDIFLAQLEMKAVEPSPDQQFEQMKAYLSEQCASADFSLQEMAERFHTTAATLNRLFKTQTDRTVTQYYTEMKMSMARALLENTDVPIHEIGQRLGYFGPNSFARRFKKDTGMTPGEYRMRLQGTAE